MQEKTAPGIPLAQAGLVDFLPFVPAFDKVAVLGECALLLLGHIPAKLRRVDAAFPFFRHIHHAGTVQVVVSQLAGPRTSGRCT